jgi:hypothetical protein
MLRAFTVWNSALHFHKTQKNANTQTANDSFNVMTTHASKSGPVEVPTDHSAHAREHRVICKFTQLTVYRHWLVKDKYVVKIFFLFDTQNLRIFSYVNGF